MRILYLSPYFWPEEIGSAPYCTDLALWLGDHGHDIRAIAFRPHYPSIQPFLDWADGSRDGIKLSDIPVDRVPVGGRGTGSFRDRLKNDLAFLRHVVRRAIAGKFRDTKVIVAYVPSVLTLYGAFAARIATGARIIAVVHDIESGLARSLGYTRNPLLFFFMRLVERFGLNRADRVVVLTEGMRTELRIIGCRRPIDILSIWAAPSPAMQPPPDGPINVMYSGNFGRKQNLEQLLPLFGRLSAEGGAYRIVLRGDGQEWLRFKTKIENAGITNAVFLPLAPAAELMLSLQSAHIHLVPQADVANYAIPSKVFSIMAAGRPYICIAVPFSPLDVLARQSGAGICIAPHDDQSLYRAVADLAGDRTRQQLMGEAGRRFVETQMSKQTILRDYEAIICS